MSVWRNVYWHRNPCSPLEDHLTTPENVLSSMCLGGEGVLFLEDEKIIFQSNFLKWVCLRWWITSELFFEALRVSENLCEKVFFFFLVWPLCWRFLDRFLFLAFQSSAEQVGVQVLSAADSSHYYSPIPASQEPVFLLPDVRPLLPPAHLTSQRKKNLFQRSWRERQLLSPTNSLTLLDIAEHLLLIIISGSTWDGQQIAGISLGTLSVPSHSVGSIIRAVPDLVALTLRREVAMHCAMDAGSVQCQGGPSVSGGRPRLGSLLRKLFYWHACEES